MLKQWNESKYYGNNKLELLSEMELYRHVTAWIPTEEQKETSKSKPGNKGNSIILV